MYKYIIIAILLMWLSLIAGIQWAKHTAQEEQIGKFAVVCGKSCEAFMQFNNCTCRGGM